MNTNIFAPPPAQEINVSFAEISGFLRSFGFNPKFSDYDEGLIISDWNYDFSRNDDVLRFLLQKYPVAVSSFINRNTNTIRITIRK